MQAETLQARCTIQKNTYNPFFKDWILKGLKDLSVPQPEKVGRKVILSHKGVKCPTLNIPTKMSMYKVLEFMMGMSW